MSVDDAAEVGVRREEAVQATQKVVVMEPFI